MFKRTSERPRPPIEVDPKVPRLLSDVTVKCLEIRPTQRYQSAREILQDLEAWRGGAKRGLAAPSFPRRRGVVSAPLSVPPGSRCRKWLVPALLVLLAVAAFVAFKRPGFHPRQACRRSAICFSRDPALSQRLQRFFPGLDRSKCRRHAEHGRRPVGPIAYRFFRSPASSLERSSHPRECRLRPRHAAPFGRVFECRTSWFQAAMLNLAIRSASTPHSRTCGATAAFLKVEAAGEKDVPAAIDRLAELSARTLRCRGMRSRS